jgi:hypothetical protein
VTQYIDAKEYVGGKEVVGARGQGPGMIFSKITDSEGSQNGCLPNLVQMVAGGRIDKL